MHVLNSSEDLQGYPVRLQQSMYGIFGIFQDKVDGTLSIGFGEDRHVSLRRKMEQGRDMIGGGVITYENGHYKILGRTSDAHGYPELPLEFMQSIAADVCRVLQTDSVSVPVKGDVIKMTK